MPAESGVTIITKAVPLWDPPPEPAVRELHGWLSAVVADLLTAVVPDADLRPSEVEVALAHAGWPKTLCIEQSFGDPARRGAWGHALVRHRFDNPRDGGGFELFANVRHVDGGIDLAFTASGYWGSSVPLVIRDRGRRRVAAVARELAQRPPAHGTQ